MSWMRSRSCVALAAAGLFAVPSSWCGQNALNLQSGGAEVSNTANAPAQNAPVLKVEVRLVLVDVAVTNKKGEPVIGLKKEAFTVLEDGAPQNLASFEERHEAPYGEALRTTPNSTGSLPLNVYTASQTVQPSDSVNVLLLDWLNTQPADQVYVRTQVIKYLKTVPPGTRLAIFALTRELRIVQGFTTETARLLAAINDRKAGATSKSVGLLATQSRKASDQELIEMMTKAQTAPVAISAVRDFQMNSTSRETGDRSVLTIAALRELQHYLAAIPGRKNIFWFAGSFPVSTFPGAGPVGGPSINFAGTLRQTADQFGPDRIAIYPFSAAGMTEAAGLDPSQGLDRRATATMANNLADKSSAPQQAAMEAIAKETGGAAFYNANDLERQITHAVEDAAHYYTLSYAPTDAAPDGKFRTIQVKLADGNYRLSYRRGYYTETAAQRATVASQEKETDPLLALMRFGMPDFDQIVYRVRVAPEQNQPAPGASRAGVNQEVSGPVTRYGVDFTIPLHSLTLPVSEGEVRDSVIEIMLVAYEKNGAPLNLVTTTNQFKLPVKLYNGNQNIEIHAREEIDLPNREVYLRAGLYERSSGNVGTVGFAVGPPSPR